MKKSPLTSFKQSSFNKAVNLLDTEFIILRDLIHEKLGIFYHESKRDLIEDKLSDLVLAQGFTSFLDYYYLLKYDIASTGEWKQVVDALRVPETFFWREFEQVQTLVKVLVPQYFAQYQPYPLKIWSAACSTGEEPLSIVMALNEAGWFKKGAAIEIIASDLSYMALQRAQQGLFRPYSFRKLPEDLRNKYFKAEGESWRISPELVARIRWVPANLTVKNEIISLANAHIIFCRNVFIYFSEDMIRKVLRNFFELMPAPGHLFVSVSESLLKLTTDFQLQEIGGTFVYVKPKNL
ncbi:MAG: chemotaxis protein CheR [Beggiatoa sp. IS2]|nr:MAG: chemotaxis protein CheR [Beggiatoa sp. IS2]